MRKVWGVLFLALVLVTFVTVPVFAQSEPITGIAELDEVLASAGLGVLIMAIVELLKRVGAIPDGNAGKVATILGVVGYVVMIILQQFQFDITGEQGQLVVELLTKLVNLAITVFAALKSYNVLRSGEILLPLPGRE